VTNEQYLVASYFLVAAACLALGLTTYVLLRRSFEGITKAIPGGKLGLIFRKLFLVGVVLPAMAGFFSVTFRSCKKETYQAVIADRSFLIAKNQEQLGACMLYICVALLLWGLLVAIWFATIGKRIENGGNSGKGEP
jgi:hypothetical protein